MQTIDQQLNTAVMRRVHIICSLRRICSPSMIKFYIGVVLFWQTIIRVSVLDVYHNLSQATALPGYYHFLSGAVTSTELATQIFLGLLIVITAWLAKDIYTNRRNRVLAVV